MMRNFILAFTSLSLLSNSVYAAPPTCSRLKAACDKAVASRGFTSTSQCPQAYGACMQTGAWRTSAKTVTGVTRK